MKHYISHLRVISTYAVILLHVAAIYVGQFHHIPLQDWNVANLLDSLCRFCIPIFLMISGALFLDKEESLGDFVYKRLKRILWPFLFWTTCYFIVNNFNNFNSSNLLLQLKKYGMYLYQHASAGHFWYIYMIIGLYLFIPILRKWTIHATKNELLYFLAIWSVTLFMTKHTLPYFPAISFPYFSQYIGFLVLGHYLDKYHDINNRLIGLVSAIVFILSIFLTYNLTQYFSVKYGELIRHFYAYLAPNVVLASITLFIFIKSVAKVTPSKIVQLVDHCSYGIYLVHILVIIKLRPMINIYSPNEPLTLFVHIIILSIIILFVSFLIIFTLSRIKPLKPFIT